MRTALLKVSVVEPDPTSMLLVAVLVTPVCAGKGTELVALTVGRLTIQFQDEDLL
jgi:hypothetical protein